ncbi:MAG: ribonuclease Z [Candidatus Woesearchaeota archaeon]|jgi:ribonuclease BN (tRNA processing enzyme)|nr:ribonuclease Z [Candidatus Woesearchaeota archaeon]
MLIKILGSGTCVPSLKRNSPSIYIGRGNKHVLVDCGSGALKQLEKANLSYKEIDIVFFTHFHTDHIADLNPLIQALNWTPGFVRKKDLLLVGPVGIKKFIQSYIRPVSGDPLPDTFKIIIEEIKDKLVFDGFSVECAKTNHNDESIAYKFTENEKSLVISGDSDYDENLIAFADGCDLFILECSFDNSQKQEGHLISRECGEIAKKANVKKLILTHLYPGKSESVRLKETKEIFDNTILAEDLLEIKL